MRTTLVGFACMLLLGVSQAGEDKKPINDLGKNVTFSGTFARDGNKLIFWISKQRQFIVSPAANASEETKKQISLDNLDALSKSKWIIKGRSQPGEGGLYLTAESIEVDPNAGKGKKK